MATMEFNIDTRDLEDNLRNHFDEFKAKNLDHIHKTLTEFLHTKAQDYAPVNTGTMVKKSHINYLGNLKSEVVFPGKEAVYMEYGTGIYADEEARAMGASGQPIKPVDKKALAWTDRGPRPPSGDGAAWQQAVQEGRGHIVKQVLGSHPTMFMRKAIEWCRANIHLIIEEAVRTQQ